MDMMDFLDNEQKIKVNYFMEATGVKNQEMAIEILETNNFNVQNAINLFLEGESSSPSIPPVYNPPPKPTIKNTYPPPNTSSINRQPLNNSFVSPIGFGLGNNSILQDIAPNEELIKDYTNYLEI